MIVGFVGVPGSGKTYEAVKKIVFNLLKGRHVYTNIDGMDQGPCQEMLKGIAKLDDFEFDRKFHFLDRDEVPNFWQVARPGSFIVLDEVHKVFNCRDWQSKKNLAFADWASTHRHHGYDLILITQDMEKVEKQVRSLLDWTYVFRKVNFLGSAVKKKYICYSYSGDDTRGKPLSTSVRTYDQRYFLCYQSYATKDAKEVSFMKHVNVLKHPVFFALPLVLAVALYLLFGRSSLATGDLFGQESVRKNNDKIIAKLRSENKVSTTPLSPSPSPSFSNVSSASVPVAPVQVVNNPVPVWSRYMIDGVVRGDGQMIVLVNGISVRLPSPYLRDVDLGLKVCKGVTDIFGDPARVRVLDQTVVPSRPGSDPIEPSSAVGDINSLSDSGLPVDPVDLPAEINT